MTRSKTSKSPRASDEERKERRRAANRRSAQKSRYREMVLMDELQKTVSQLTKRNAALKEENQAFRRDVMILKRMMEGRKQPPMDQHELSFPCSSPLNTMADDAIRTMNIMQRTPSPVESHLLFSQNRFLSSALHPQHNPALLTADNLLQVVMTTGSADRL